MQDGHEAKLNELISLYVCSQAAAIFPLPRITLRSLTTAYRP